MSLEPFRTGVFWRITTRVPLVNTPFVDWYFAPTLETAIEEAQRDAKVFGLPDDAIHTGRLATAEETKTCERVRGMSAAS